MAVENIYWKIVKYLEANSKTTAEFAAKNVKILVYLIHQNH